MVINFKNPWVLLLIPLAIFFVLYTAGALEKMYKLRRRLLLILRNAVLILLILALSGLSIKWIVDTTTTIYVVDASDSMAAYRQEVEGFVRQALEQKSGKDQAGVVAFGDNAQIESFVAKNVNFSKIETAPNGMYTNIENSLTTALSLLPQNSKKRVVLLTDGEENTGNSTRLASSMLEQGVDFKIYKLDRDIPNEVAVDSISVPQSLSMGEEFSIVVNITSKIKTGAKLTLISGRDKAAEQRVELQKGSNRFVFRDTATAGGFKSYRVIVEPDVDTETRNNEASAFTNVLDKPRILVIQDKPGEADEVVRMLSSSGIDYVLKDAKAAPGSLQEMTAYKSIITCNVSAENLSDGFLNSLEAYVKDFGGGFIATGGEDSFALGGYYKTPLEKVLPVNMELKGKKEIPDMSIVLIIDKSGSMTEGHGGITKLDLAKEAAARTLDSLRPKDQIGVIAFDDTSYWVVKTQKATDPEAIREDIGTIRSGGGTSILPALREGYESLKKTNTKIKHIILLTDGQAEKNGFDELVGQISKDGITVSTVAVGSDADTSLLQSIAEGAKGRFYYTNDSTNIPRIFAKETFMAARAYLNNKPFTPNITAAHPILSGVAEGGMPSLLGYVAATPKDAARMLLASPDNDPILTVWQYGLGKTAAWNSDISGKWSANYVGWEKNLKLWQNIINWTIEKYRQDDIQLETQVQGGKGIITLTNKAASGELETRATIVSPDMKSREVVLYPTAPGQYSGSFDIKETGAYLIKAVQGKNGETTAAASTGISVQYSPEYKLQPQSELLDRLAKEAGGVFIKNPAEVYKGKIKDIFGAVELTNFLLIAALILFILDIALRRLNLPLNAVEEKLEVFRKRLIREKKKPVLKTMEIKPREEAIRPAPVKKNKQQKQAPPRQEEKKPEAENLDTSALLKRKKNRE